MDNCERTYSVQYKNIDFLLKKYSDLTEKNLS
jgi:hypothetical protein